MKRRRSIIVGLSAAAAAWPLGGQARSTAKRLAIFSPFEPAERMRENGDNRYYGVLFAELRRQGHVEGQNLIVERYGRSQNTAGPVALAQAVADSKPDVVYAIPGAFFRGLLPAVPVVALSADPIALGMATSLARPGGNFTGVSVDTGPSLYGKRIALLREVVPVMSKVGYLGLRDAWERVQGAPVRAAADALGLALLPMLLDPPTDDAAYRASVTAARQSGVDAVMVGDSPDVTVHRQAVVDALMEARLPAMHTFPESVEAGGLMAYSFDLTELNRRAAVSIDAVLRGVRPADIPFYQATNFVLSLNLKTARTLGITFPPTVLAAADETIE